MAAEERRKQKEQIKILKQQVGSLMCVLTNPFLSSLSQNTQSPCALQETLNRYNVILTVPSLLVYEDMSFSETKLEQSDWKMILSKDAFHCLKY